MDFNDKYGHAEGDIALQEIAHRITQAAEYETVIGRIGSDEFAMIYYGDRRSEDDLISELTDKLNKSSPLILTDTEGHNISVGVNAQKPSAKVMQFEPGPQNAFTLQVA